MRFTVVIFSALFFVFSAFAADDMGKVTIHAANVRYFGEENRSTFTGNVVMINSAYTLTADRAEVFFAEGNAVKLIRCFSNVNIKTDNLLALSNFADIDAAQKTITVFGNARVWQEDNYMEGDSVTFNYSTREISVRKGKGGQVRVIMNPKED
jgi:lipopolysaccharide transport protein LptA